MDAAVAPGRWARFAERCYWTGRARITPGLRNAQYAYRDLVDQTLKPGDTWLDLGCGRSMLPTWLHASQATQQQWIDRAASVIGIDPDPDALADNPWPIDKRQGTAQALPLPSSSVDLITANMVFEHLDHPLSVLRETARVLRPGGRLIMHTPNFRYPTTALNAAMPSAAKRLAAQLLEGRAHEDVYPTRYRANTPLRIRQLAEDAGLDAMAVQCLPTSAETRRLGPVSAVELVFIRLTLTETLAGWRSNLLATLARPRA